MYQVVMVGKHVLGILRNNCCKTSMVTWVTWFVEKTGYYAVAVEFTEVLIVSENLQSLVACGLDSDIYTSLMRICRFYSGVACEHHSQVHLACSSGKVKCPVERYNLGGLSMSITEAGRVMWDDPVLFSHSTAGCLNTCPKNTHKYLWEVLLLANSIAILLVNANLLFLLSLRSADTWLM